MGVNLPWVYVHSAVYIYESYLVKWFSKDLCSIGGGVGVNLPWVYVHCAIYMKLIWCNGFPDIYAQLEEGWGSIYHGYMYIVLYI